VVCGAVGTKACPLTLTKGILLAFASPPVRWSERLDHLVGVLHLLSKIWSIPSFAAEGRLLLTA
jgi:hypothetical protein